MAKPKTSRQWNPKPLEERIDEFLDANLPSRPGYALPHAWGLALEKIEREVDGIDWSLASYRDLQAALRECRKLARVALGKDDEECK